MAAVVGQADLFLESPYRESVNPSPFGDGSCFHDQVGVSLYGVQIQSSSHDASYLQIDWR
jgi:hypothetical protein